MTTIKTDENNNIIFNNGAIVIVKDGLCAAQSLSQRLGLVLGEDEENKNFGVDYFTAFASVFGGQSFLIDSIRELALSDPDSEITSIEDLKINFLNRVFSVNMTVNSIYGRLVI